MRQEHLNLPAILGTLVAVGAASYWLSQELVPYLATETWDRLTVFMVMLGSLAAITPGSLAWRFVLAIQRDGDSSFVGVCLGFLFLLVGFAIPVSYLFVLVYLLG